MLLGICILVSFALKSELQSFFPKIILFERKKIDDLNQKFPTFLIGSWHLWGFFKNLVASYGCLVTFILVFLDGFRDELIANLI